MTSGGLDPPVDVLIVGAGPAGLALALGLRMLGATARVVDRLDGPRATGPALAMQPRTMELLDGLGVAEAVESRGRSDVDLFIHIGDETVGGALHGFDFPDTRYSAVTLVPQAEVETAFRRRLEREGTAVEWSTRFDDAQQRGGWVESTVECGGRPEAIRSRFVVGCDGTDSTVRRRLQIRFRGRRYRQILAVGDVDEIDVADPSAAHAFVAPSGIVFAFPLPTSGSRVIAVSPSSLRGRPSLPEAVHAHLGFQPLGAVRWSTLVRPHRRLARRYRRGRVFLAGDAAHAHSPAGAQGMNTGIQDSMNLAWKLALASQGGSYLLLDSYERERRPVARDTIRFTDLAFALETATWSPLRLARRWSAPVARSIIGFPGAVSGVARAVSGLDIGYRAGPLVEEGAALKGLPPPGARVPGPALEGMGAGFRLLSIGDPPEPAHLSALVAASSGAVPHRHLHGHDWPGVGSPPVETAFCLVRPDGHIATWDTSGSLELVEAYLRRFCGTSTGPGEATTRSTW